MQGHSKLSKTWPWVATWQGQKFGLKGMALHWSSINTRQFCVANQWHSHRMDGQEFFGEWGWGVFVNWLLEALLLDPHWGSAPEPRPVFRLCLTLCHHAMYSTAVICTV